MRRALIIRKGVSLEKLTDTIDFINNYKDGILKAIHTDESTNSIKEFMNKLTSKDAVLLFLGSDPSSSNFEKEIYLTHRLGLRRTVFTLDEEKFPILTPTGIPSTWKVGNSNYVQKFTESNILRAIVGATKWGV